MENELRNEINRLREELRVARTVHVVIAKTGQGDRVTYDEKGLPMILANAANAELEASKFRQVHGCSFVVKTIEVK